MPVLDRRETVSAEPEIVEYSTSRARRVSALALLAPVVALLGFPFTPNWYFSDQSFNALAAALSIDVQRVRYFAPLVWSSLALLFNLFAYLRIRFSHGALRGWRPAVIGLGLSFVMFFLLIVTYLSHRDIVGPI